MKYSKAEERKATVLFYKLLRGLPRCENKGAITLVMKLTGVK